ncbi:hypothetical protein M8J75_013748 [Diaphorina citri]|nr:hypothetical protein M8J75_013748 [Diaphorina citri]KAI5707427.1 hypothetical protein M8J77_002336 [Diaphorina citri]
MDVRCPQMEVLEMDRNKEHPRKLASLETNGDSEREAFRKALDKSGVTECFIRTVEALMKQEPFPENPMLFVSHFLANRYDTPPSSSLPPPPCHCEHCGGQEGPSHPSSYLGVPPERLNAPPPWKELQKKPFPTGKPPNGVGAIRKPFPNLPPLPEEFPDHGTGSEPASPRHQSSGVTTGNSDMTCLSGTSNRASDAFNVFGVTSYGANGSSSNAASNSSITFYAVGGSNVASSGTFTSSGTVSTLASNKTDSPSSAIPTSVPSSSTPITTSVDSSSAITLSTDSSLATSTNFGTINTTCSPNSKSSRTSTSSVGAKATSTKSTGIVNTTKSSNDTMTKSSNDDSLSTTSVGIASIGTSLFATGGTKSSDADSSSPTSVSTSAAGTSTVTINSTTNSSSNSAGMDTKAGTTTDTNAAPNSAGTINTMSGTTSNSSDTINTTISTLSLSNTTNTMAISTLGSSGVAKTMAGTLLNSPGTINTLVGTTLSSFSASNSLVHSDDDGCCPPEGSPIEGATHSSESQTTQDSCDSEKTKCSHAPMLPKTSVKDSVGTTTSVVTSAGSTTPVVSSVGTNAVTSVGTTRSMETSVGTTTAMGSPSSVGTVTSVTNSVGSATPVVSSMGANAVTSVGTPGGSGSTLAAAMAEKKKLLKKMYVQSAQETGRGHKGPSVGGSGCYPGTSGTESSPSLPLGVPHYATFEPGTAPPSNPFGGPGNPSNGNGSSYGNPSTYQGVSGPGNQSTYQGIYRNPPGGVGGNISPSPGIFSGFPPQTPNGMANSGTPVGFSQFSQENGQFGYPQMSTGQFSPGSIGQSPYNGVGYYQGAQFGYAPLIPGQNGPNPYLGQTGYSNGRETTANEPFPGQTEGYSPPLLGPLGQLSGTVAFQPSTFGQPSPYGQPSESSPFNQLSSYQPSGPFNSHERNSSFADQISERSGPFNSQPERNGYNQHPSGRNSPFNNQLSERGAPFSSQPLDRNSFSHQPSDRNPYQPSGGGGRPSQFRPNYAPKTDWAANSGKRNASGGYTKREFAAKTEFSAKSEYAKSDYSPKKEFAKSEFSPSDFSPKKEFAKSEFSSKSATGEVYYGYRAKSVLGGSGTTAVGGHAGRGFGNGHPSGHGYQGREERGPSNHEKRENGNVFQGRDERSPNSYEKRESGHERSVGSGSGYESGQGREERGTNSYEKRDQSGHDFQGRGGHGNQDSEERVPS